MSVSYARMLEARIQELERLLRLLIPVGWREGEARPDLRSLYEECERALGTPGPPPNSAQ